MIFRALWVFIVSYGDILGSVWGAQRDKAKKVLAFGSGLGKTGNGFEAKDPGMGVHRTGWGGEAASIIYALGNER
jgi:hypothetical protein